MNSVAKVRSAAAGPIVGTSVQRACASFLLLALAGMAVGQARSPGSTATISQTITVTSAPALQSGYPHTTSKLVSLAGQANAASTRRVTVNSQPAVWTAAQAQWSIANVSLVLGLDRVVIQAFDANEVEIDRFGFDIWCDTGTMTAKAGGTLGADATWTAAGGPYHVTGSITIPAGRTLTIEPGTTVFLDANCSFSINGQLTAQGTEYQRIRFTRIPGTSGSWRGFTFTNARQPNVLAYTDIEFGDGGSQCISLHNSQVLIDWATFSNMRSKYFDIWEPQVTIRHSTFANLGGTYFCTAEHLLADGWFIAQGNLFGKNTGDNDIFHLNRISVKGGPAATILDNVFSGAGDDMVDDNESDTHIEGNLFMHANEGNAANHGASAAVTTGPGGSTGVSNLLTQHLTVVRNVFFRNDYGIISKTGAYSQIYNNVFVGNRGGIMFDETDRNDAGPGRGAYIESCIFWGNQAENVALASGAMVDVIDPRAFDSGRLSKGQPQVTVDNCIVPVSFQALGTANTNADPCFVDADRQFFVDVNLPRFNTGFPGYTEGGYLLAGVVPDVHLRPQSPARGAGFNGVDMGFYVPAAASIAGIPTSPTTQTWATLTVAGLDIYGYKYRLVHAGATDPWSREMQQMKSVTQILLTGSSATVTCTSHGYANGDLVQIIGADALCPYFNGSFAIFGVTANTFSYAVVPGSAAAQNQTQPRDLWGRKTEPIQLTGLADGTYTVEVIRKNSQGVWQDESQPSTATWTVNTSGRPLLNDTPAAN
jgi:hypothetical protein